MGRGGCVEGWDGWGIVGLISLETIRMDHSGQGWTSSCQGGVRWCGKGG